MRKTLFKWILLLLLAAYVAGMSIWASGEAERHVCRGIEIEIKASRGSADQLAAKGLETELRKFPQKIVGARVNSINTLAIERYLSKFNNFETVRCLMTPDNILKVVATPLIPEIRVFDSRGGSYYVNKDGKRIDALAKFFVDVPIVQGDFSKSFPETKLLPMVRFLTTDPDLKVLTASVKVDGPDNILLIPRIGGHVVNFGDTTRLAEKRDALLTAYKSILPRRGWDTYDTISVKFRDQIVCTRRDRSRPQGYAADAEEVDLEEATLSGLDANED